MFCSVSPFRYFVVRRSVYYFAGFKYLWIIFFLYFSDRSMVYYGHLLFSYSSYWRIIIQLFMPKLYLCFIGVLPFFHWHGRQTSYDSHRQNQEYAKTRANFSIMTMNSGIPYSGDTYRINILGQRNI